MGENLEFFKSSSVDLRFIPFYLSEDFVSSYSHKKIPWGPVGELAFMRTYSRWIELPNGKKRKERWVDTVKRVVEGIFTIQKRHCFNSKVPWNNAKAQNSAKIMFDLIFHMKFLPAGRSLWLMGCGYIERKGAASILNCSFHSTKNLAQDPITPFKFLMDMSMLGVGVSVDTKGANQITIQKPKIVDDVAVIPDSREGWVESVCIVLSGFFLGTEIPCFDYSAIRPEGSLIKDFGGEASGPGPLKDLHQSLMIMLTKRIGHLITSVDIVDIADMIGKCVVSGNVRRSAILSLGDPDDEAFISMKDRDLHPKECDSHRWASNNSVKARIGQNYSKIAERIAKNGEPGILWLEDTKKYGRFADPPDYKDEQAEGVNPCVMEGERLLLNTGYEKIEELVGRQLRIQTPDGVRNGKVIYSGVKDCIALVTQNGEIRVTPNHKMILSDGNKCESGNCIGKELSVKGFRKKQFVENIVWLGKHKVYDFMVATTRRHVGYVNGYAVSNCGEQVLFDKENCNLVETFPSLHETYDEYQLTLKYAYLYAKTVTLLPTHWEASNAVMLRNRRIGTSQSGIIDAFAKHGRQVMLTWSDKGYQYLRKLDAIYSDWLCIPRSIKITTVKPSGTVSLLPGVSPGIHYPHSEYYIRRVTVSKNSTLVNIFKNAGYTIEDSHTDKTAVLINIPVHTENFIKGKNEVTMWEQLLNAADYQKWWADNQVSITVTFKEEESRDIETALSMFDSRLKGVSMLPVKKHGYKQAPYEEITRDKYNEMVSKILKPDYSEFIEQEVGEKFCDGESCNIK